MLFLISLVVFSYILIFFIFLFCPFKHISFCCQLHQFGENAQINHSKKQIQFDILQEFAIHHSVQFQNETKVKSQNKIRVEKTANVNTDQMILNDDPL